MSQLGVAVIGAGYWGPNLARNLRGSPAWDLVAVCDLDEMRARRVVGPRSSVAVETSTGAVLARRDVDAVVIATPAATHAPVALAALAAGKHVLLEKPMASSSQDACRLIAAARDAGRVLMVDHTFCYTPAVQYIRRAIGDGLLGDVLYVDSTRINLGLVSPDVNVFWDLAPHDIAILDHVLPDGLSATAVSATGADPLGTGKPCIGYLTMPLAGDAIAHVSVNWLSPTKIRTLVIGGSRRMLVWDDTDPVQRIQVHDRGVDVAFPTTDARANREMRVSYRSGDITVPALSNREGLAAMVEEFASAIREEREPLTSGRSGLTVLKVLEAADASLAAGTPVPLS